MCAPTPTKRVRDSEGQEEQNSTVNKEGDNFVFAEECCLSMLERERIVNVYAKGKVRRLDHFTPIVQPLSESDRYPLLPPQLLPTQDSQLPVLRAEPNFLTGR